MLRSTQLATAAAVALLLLSGRPTLAQEADEPPVVDSAATLEDVPFPVVQQQTPAVRRGGPLFRSSSPEDVLELTRGQAAERVGVPLDQVQVLSIEPTEWSNLGLGCLAAGLRFGEVTIPGYIVQVDAAGTMLTYHTDRGLRAIVCEAGPQVTTVN
jgi:hypothetical protein